jgi:formylmethanofuran dehydrogenase subunit E
MELDTKHVVAFIKESSNKAEAIDWLEKISTYDIADIAVKCVICGEYTPMNSHDYRAQGAFICNNCRAAVLHIRNILDNGGSIV